MSAMERHSCPGRRKTRSCRQRATATGVWRRSEAAELAVNARDSLLATSARALSDAADMVPAPPPSNGSRERAIAAMRVALRQRATRKRRRVWLSRGAIAASVLLGLLGTARAFSEWSRRSNTRLGLSDAPLAAASRPVESPVAATDAQPSRVAVPASPFVPAATSIAAAQPRVPGPPASKAASKTVGLAPTSAPRDLLALRNELFSTALAAKRRGELPAALSGFDEYLARFPGGELAENAAAQRIGLLAKVDPSRAAAAARAYLTRWPTGFAQQEARALVGEAP